MKEVALISAPTDLLANYASAADSVSWQNAPPPPLPPQPLV